MKEAITFGSITGSCLDNHGAFSIGVGTKITWGEVLQVPDVRQHLKHGDTMTLRLQTYFAGYIWGNPIKTESIEFIKEDL